MNINRQIKNFLKAVVTIIVASSLIVPIVNASFRVENLSNSTYNYFETSDQFFGNMTIESKSVDAGDRNVMINITGDWNIGSLALGAWQIVINYDPSIIDSWWVDFSDGVGQPSAFNPTGEDVLGNMTASAVWIGNGPISGSGLLCRFMINISAESPDCISNLNILDVYPPAMVTKYSPSGEMGFLPNRYNASISVTANQNHNCRPVISDELPSDSAQDIPISISQLEVLIEDPEGDLFDWTISTSPNIGSSSGSGETNGTKVCTVSGLTSDMVYTWTVSAVNIGSSDTRESVFEFRTEPRNLPPEYYQISPSDGEDVTIFLGNLRVCIWDPEGNNFEYTIETNPDVGKISGVNESNGVKICYLDVLDYETTYTWYVNSTDYGGGQTSCLEYTFTSQKAPTPPDSDSWPMYQGNTQNTGNLEVPTINTNNTKWIKNLNSKISKSSVIAYGRLYTVGQNISTNEAEVFCLNAETGCKIWNISLGAGLANSDPCLFDNKIYVNVANNLDSRLYCIDILNGSIIWDHNPGSGWISSGFAPTVTQSCVIYAAGSISSISCKLFCLDAHTSSELWTYKSGSAIKSSPAVYSNRLYLSIGDETGSRVMCLNLNNGSIIWSYARPYYRFTGSPAIVDDKVYVGATHKFYPDFSAGFCCINASDGSEIWVNDIGNCRGSCSVAYGYVYFSLDELLFQNLNNITCLNGETGEIVWEKPDYYSSRSITTMAIANGKLYFGSDKEIKCIDAFSGEQFWNYSTDDKIETPPAIAYGNIYFGSKDGLVYCFGSNLVNNPPNVPSAPVGEIDVGTFQIREYSSSVIDPDGDSVRIRFDWDSDGDHNVSCWTGFAESILSYAWQEDGVYSVRAQAIDEHGAMSDWSDPLNVVVSDLVADLAATGNLIFDEVKPGSKVEGEFKVRNVGDNGSWLNWEISRYPSGWGNNWSFSPSNGSGLKVEDSWLVIEVSFMVPDKEEAEFSGRISVVNCDNSSDSINIDVVCTTPSKKNSLVSMFISILHRLSERFSRLFSLFPFFQNIIDQYSSDLS